MIRLHDSLVSGNGYKVRFLPESGAILFYLAERTPYLPEGRGLISSGLRGL